MTHEPLRVEPVEMEYYQDRDSAIARVVWLMALVAIVSGAFNVLTGLIHVVGRAAATGYWQYMNNWQTVVFVGGGVMAVVLLISGIGCLTYRPAARTGMLVYSYLMVGVQMFSAGAYIVMMLRNPGLGTAPPAMLESGMMVLNYVAWMVQGCVFPVLTIVIFRMKAVEQLFVR